MKLTVAVLAAVLAVTAAAPLVDVQKLADTHVGRMRIIQAVQDAQTTWEAGINQRFRTSTYSDIQRLLGTYMGANSLPVVDAVANDIPENFDARTAWPQCSSIQEVRDQADCGSCWAFGSVEAATDRVCIATKGEQQLHLSAEDLLSCCSSCGFGCNGGYPSAAWSWFQNTGVVTGGNYGDNSWCRAYSLEPCDHHTTGQYQPCPSSLSPTPACKSQCDSESNYNATYSQDKRKFKSSYSVSSNPQAIQTEIMTYGPVTAAFTVYADFEAYKSGVYQHVTGSYLGGHAIKILGWGVDNGTPYWLVANSWNNDWGENGFFRIKRGNNECGIEGQIVAGRYL